MSRRKMRGQPDWNVAPAPSVRGWALCPHGCDRVLHTHGHGDELGHRGAHCYFAHSRIDRLDVATPEEARAHRWRQKAEGTLRPGLHPHEDGLPVLHARDHPRYTVCGYVLTEATGRQRALVEWLVERVEAGKNVQTPGQGHWRRAIRWKQYLRRLPPEHRATLIDFLGAALPVEAREAFAPNERSPDRATAEASSPNTGVQTSHEQAT